MKSAHEDLSARKCNELLRLALAMRCFKGALELCHHVMKLQLRESDFLYGPCMTGIVVTYSRPFSRPAKKIDILGGRFQRFNDLKFRAVHKELLSLRNKVFAHHDASDLDEFDVRNPNGVPVYITTLEFGKDRHGEYYICPDTTVPQVTVDSIPGYIDLIKFQMRRIETATDQLIKSMAPPNKKYKLGRYQVGLNFP